MREHIDFCFTCIMKTLPLEEQIALMLSDLYDFADVEAAEVLQISVEGFGGLRQRARTAMAGIFERRCALITQRGACRQCAELNALFNPHQAEQQELTKLALVQAAQDPAGRDLLAVRTALVRSIDPVTAAGTNLHEVMMQVVRQASGRA
jgi:RNA polymerase sigma-70 factor (ECF subfamily)